MSPSIFPDLQRIKDSLSSIYHCFVYYSEAPSTLLIALNKELPEISKDSWEERMSWGGVYINGKVAYQDVPLKTPMKLEYYQPKVPVDQQASCYPKFSKDWIIYEDSDLLVCFKPAGLSCQKAKEQQKISLYQYLSDHYGRPIHLPSRLDFSTSGLILCSRNPDTHGIVQELFVSRSIVKKYLLKISKPVDWEEITIEQRIGRDPRHPVLRKAVEDRGKPALSHFQLLDKGEDYSAIIAKPYTGRTHQLRVHAKYGLGCAIVGDNFYSGEPDEELNLCSYFLDCQHPILNTRLALMLPENLFPSWVKPEWVEKIRTGD